VDIQNLENDLKDVSGAIAAEQDEIQKLRLKKEELTKQIQIAKENPVKKQEEAPLSPSSPESAGQTNDFRHLLKKRNAPPPAEKPTAAELDQKDFRNLLKKRNNNQ